MKRGQLPVIATAGILAFLTTVAEGIGAPEGVLAVPGILLVFVLPGYAAVCAVLPGRELSRGERLLSSLGTSLAITTCVAVLLAATPVGLSQGSAAATLGLGTAALSLCGWIRMRRFVNGCR